MTGTYPMPRPLSPDPGLCRHFFRPELPPRRLISCWLVVSIVAVGVGSVEAQARRRDEPRFGIRPFQEQHQKLKQDFLGELATLHRRCFDAGARGEAEEIERLIEHLNEPVRSLESLPAEIRPPLASDLPADERARQSALRSVRERYAADLFQLAAKCKRVGYRSFAYSLIREAADHDSDHPQVRKLLGYVRHGDEWVTPVAQALLKQHKVWHDDFGWIPKNHVDRYEAGERNVDGRWMSAEKEAELRRDFRRAWEIRTDHYVIKTNHSLERGVELGVALEEFYRYFMQAFNGFFDTGDDFPGAAAANFRPYVVHYYRTEAEYDETLKPKIPQIEITNGLYYTSDRVAYFFDDPNANGYSTLYHEASHQLFYESEKRDRPIAEAAHFWIIEGISCYLESFRSENGEISIGDPNFERFRAARIRLLQSNYYVPLDQFCAMGMKAFQTDPNISLNYSQASGLAHFFMNYEGGVYRDAVIEHLRDLYNGSRRVRHRTLEDLTGVDYATLDAQYREYITEMERIAGGQAAVVE